MPLVVIVCIAIVVVASVWMAVDILTADGYCERHARVYHGTCPDCEKEWRDAA